MKENLMIVPVQLTHSNSSEPTLNETHTSIASCHFKMNGAEATFYNGVDKNILHAVLAEMSKHARRKFKNVLGENGKAKLAIEYCDQIFKIERAPQGLSPEERYEQRQLQVKPVIEAFYDFLGASSQ